MSIIVMSALSPRYIFCVWIVACEVATGCDEVGIPCMGHAAMENFDILCNVVQYVGDTQFLFFAPVSRGWRLAWGKREAATSYVTSYTSVPQLMYSFEHGLPLTRLGVCNAIALLGSLELLKCAHDHGCPWDEGTCAQAAKGGHLEVLQWARENGCSWNYLTCQKSARGGHLHVLQWARANGCPWNTWTCSEAAAGGHLAVLQWARDNEGPWDLATCVSAVDGGNPAVLQWLRENGCPWDELKFDKLPEQLQQMALELAREVGCPWNDESLCADGGHELMVEWLRRSGALGVY